MEGWKGGRMEEPVLESEFSWPLLTRRCGPSQPLLRDNFWDHNPPDRSLLECSSLLSSGLNERVCKLLIEI